MPFVAFYLRMQAAAWGQLIRISALQAADGAHAGAKDYIAGLQRLAGVEISGPVFALVQSGDLS